MLSLVCIFLYPAPSFCGLYVLPLGAFNDTYSVRLTMFLLALECGYLLWARVSRPADTCPPATAGGAPPSSADPETSRGPSSDLCRAESGHSRAGHKANGGRPQDAGRVGERSDTRLRGADATDAVAACGHA